MIYLQSSSFLLRFVVNDEANSFYTMTQLAINEVKRQAQLVSGRRLTKEDIGGPTDFRNLDMNEWNLLRGDRSELKPVKQSRIGKLKPILMKKHQNFISNRAKKVPSNDVRANDIKAAGDQAASPEMKHKSLMESFKRIVHMPLKPRCAIPTFHAKTKNENSGIKKKIVNHNGFEWDDDEAPLLI